MKWIQSLVVLVLVATSLAFNSGYGRWRLRPLLVKGRADKEGKSEAQTSPKKLTLGAVIQLITMGAGAPSLGEYKETDENGRMLFELEANNFLGELKGKNFNEGWVESSDDAIEKPPGFFKNLLSGGRLMEEWDKKNRKN